MDWFETNNTTFNDLRLSTTPANLQRLPRTLNTVMTLSYSLLVALGFFGNLFIIIAILECKKLQSTHNAYVCCLAIANLIVSITLSPYTAWIFANDGWLTNDRTHNILCEFMGALVTIILGNSLYTQAAIAINRYICILKPAHVYSRLFTKKSVAFSIVVLWIMPVLIVIPGLLGFGGFGYNHMIGSCLILDDSPTLIMVLVVMVIPCSFPCLVIVVFSYLKIILHFRGITLRVQHRIACASNTTEMPKELNAEISSDHEITLANDNHQPTSLHTSQRNKKQMTVVLNLCVVFLLFVICWTPILLLYFLDYHRKVPLWIYRMLFMLSTTDSSVNFFVYVKMNKGFRKTCLLIVTGKWSQINQ